LPSSVVLVLAAPFAGALVACGSTPAVRTSVQLSTLSATPRALQTSAQPVSSSAPATAGTAVPVRPRRNRIDGIVDIAKARYRDETTGAKVLQQLGRIARDGLLLHALSRGDVAGAQAEADAQLTSAANHFDHVTRISVIGGSRVLVNATVNSDGVFVVAPASRVLRLHGHGRLLGTLLVSIQDVTGYVKLVHALTGADVVARGRSGRVRTSVGAASGVRLPPSGHITIAGRGYLVRSFREVGWGPEPRSNEPLTVWILERA
jgi:hypothetical protein